VIGDILGTGIYALAGILLAVGAALWVINRLVVGKVDVDPTRLAKG
jgi:hypothetical protein